jgi:hypothetical protein
MEIQQVRTQIRLVNLNGDDFSVYPCSVHYNLFSAWEGKVVPAVLGLIRPS